MGRRSERSRRSETEQYKSNVVETLQAELDTGGNDETTDALSEDAIERIEDDNIVLRTRS